MSALTDLIGQIENPELRARIQAEVERTTKQKKFGLVFEEHLPESTPLYDVPVKVGGFVSTKIKGEGGYALMKVLSIENGEARCVTQANVESTHKVEDLVTVAPFGEPIYPYLKPLDSICNAPDSDLWHTLIEADNYHALQLLEYLYAGKVDCIYIDPPYNTGARDWKYNNDYVDGADSYRHSKWLSMMQKRLKIAKKLLNPADSVLIVTIDEKEYLHLGCLLEEMFPEARIQMISSVINPAGVSRKGEFARTNEYIFFVNMGISAPIPLELGDKWIGDIKNLARKNGLRWNTLMRSGIGARRQDSPNLFYPVFVTEDGKKIHSVGEPYYGDDLNILAPNGTKTIWPIRNDGSLGRWRVSNTLLVELIEQGYVRLGRFNDRGTIAIDYIARGEVEKIKNGTFSITGYTETGTVIIDDSDYKPCFIPGCQWNIPSHDATQQGTKLINSILGAGRFTFPKSLYAVHDTIRFFVENKPNALILDFFAGSGTTLHAVNLLNAEDGGHRRCIMVTNNEVSESEAKELSAKGIKPGDEAWNNLGIARYVTWPRTVCSISGVDIKGDPLKGDYVSSTDVPIKMSEGFKTNAVFFKLDFIDKRNVALGRAFKELLPVLWMKAGAIGSCPSITDASLPQWLILPQNQMAVLLNETAFPLFSKEMRQATNIHTLYIVTDSEKEFIAISKDLGIDNSFQIYRDYLDNFRINRNR